MGKIISDSIPFSTNASEFSYQAKMNLFLAFKADSTLLYQGSTNDSIYLNFFNTMKNSNMNQLDSVIILSSLARTDDAIGINENITDTNYVEYKIEFNY